MKFVRGIRTQTMIQEDLGSQFRRMLKLATLRPRNSICLNFLLAVISSLPRGDVGFTQKKRCGKRLKKAISGLVPMEITLHALRNFFQNIKTPDLLQKRFGLLMRLGQINDAKKGLLQLLPDANVFDNPKPEGLLERAIHIATNPGDLVLDSFAGSGTTGAVAHKMGRRWIMVELGEHCHTHIIPRLKKVIDGEDPGGVTEATDWKGGGGFRYYRLAPSLLQKDKWDNWIISKEYNAAMLAEAVCKLEGFSYAPADSALLAARPFHRADYIYVTTQTPRHGAARLL